MIRKILSNLLIFIGILAIVLAAYIFWQEQQLENTAQTASSAALEVMKTEILENSNLENEDTEILIDGSLYMGILSIPTLSLELPIQNSWSYEKLSQTPCLYQTDPMVIAGHNYKAHFGTLSNLKTGDQMLLTYANGEIEKFYVSSMKTINDTEVDAVIHSEYDLTLFTCNYNNIDQRIVVYLTKS